MISLPRLSLSAVALLLVAACGGGTSSGRPDAGPALTIRITPTEASVAAGQSTTLSAVVVSGEEAVDDAPVIKWKVDDATIAAITATAGEVKVAGLKTGTATVTATSGSLSASAVVTVTDATLRSIALTPTPTTVPAGLMQPLTATGTYTDGRTADVTSLVTWTSSSPAVARVEDSVGNKGKVTGLLLGSSTITAASGTTIGTLTVTVSAPVVQSITVTPVTSTLPMGRSVQMVATASFSDGTTGNITSQVVWTSANTAIADVSNSGLARAKAVGTTQLIATRGSVSGNASLTVTAATVNYISVTPSPTSIAKGNARQLTAIANMSDGTLINMTGQATWTSSNTAVATVSSSGLVSSVSEGATTITAAAVGSQGTASVTVVAPQVVSMTLSPTNPSVPKGLTQTFTAMATLTDGTTANVSAQASWTSSNTTVASVTSAGVATAKVVGSATITASVGTNSAAASMVVTAAQAVSITVAPATSSIAKGLTQPFAATALMTDGAMQVVTTTANWSSSDTAVATISNSGATRGTATGAGMGSATISATVGSATGTANLTAQASWSSSDTNAATVGNTTSDKGLGTAVAVGSSSITATVGSVTGIATFNVTQAVVTSITVAPSLFTILPTGTMQYTATARYSDNTTTNVTTSVSWSSSASAVATIDPATGLASGVADGTTTITATSGSFSGTATLNVSSTPVTLTSITVAPSTASVAKGRTQAFTATGTYSDTTTSDLTTLATWSSSDALVATVSNTAPNQGVATGAGVGSATIAATMGSVTGTGTLSVTPAELVSVAVTPASQTILQGQTQQFVATGTFTDGSTADVTTQATWTSAPTTVAQIGASTGLATGTGGGSATLTATVGTGAAQRSGTQTLNVTGTGPTLTSITVTPTNPSVATNTSLQLKAVATYSDASVSDVTASATWSSVNTASVTVVSGGIATTVAAGSSSVSATVGAVTGSTNVTVTTETCHVVINEVQMGTAAQAADEWFELYNPCATQFDLNATAIMYRSATGTVDLELVVVSGSRIMPPRTYVLYTHSLATNVANRDGTYTDGVGQSISATGGGIALKTNLGGSIIDAVAWGTASATHAFREGATVATPPANGQTTIRAPFNGKDSNVSSADWQLTSTSSPRAPNP